MGLRLTTVAIAGAFIMGAILGPPLGGAISTMYWNEAADGNTAVAVSWRLFDRVYPQPVGLSYGPDILGNYGDVSFGQSCSKRYMRAFQAADPGINDLSDLFREYSRRWLYAELVKQPAYDALLKLPRPVLGAFDACVEGSFLINHICQAYVKRIIDKARIHQGPRRKSALARLRMVNEAMWCAAADAEP